MNLQNSAPIGVFDSGIGGLTAFRKLVEMLPNENLIYLGDTARVPYGNRPAETIQIYAQQCTEFLLEHQVKLILIACNSVSSVALSMIEQMTTIPVVGVIKPAVLSALAQTKNGRIGIIGTRATIQSKAYELEFYKQSQATTVNLFSIACPLFVPIVEEGWHDHAISFNIAIEYLQPLRESNIDTLILGCTHYPLLKRVILSILPQVVLIDSGEEAAMEVSKILSNEQNSLPAPLSRSLECFITDISTENTLQLVQNIFGITSDCIHQTSIDHKVVKSKLYGFTAATDVDLTDEK